MEYYIYQADLYCEDCGVAICDDLDQKGLTPKDPDDQYSYDSDEYPKECCDSCESDMPDNCAACHRPFNNTLTTDGIQYVINAIKEALSLSEEERNKIHDCYKGTYYEGSRWIEITRDWAKDLQWYSLSEEDQELVDTFLEKTKE